MVIGLVAAAVSALLLGWAAVLQARAVRDLPEAGSGLGTTLRAAATSRPLLIVIAAYLLGWVLHLVSIAYLPLFLAQSGIAASLAVTAVIAARWLGESLTALQWLAMAATVVGLALLVAAAGEPGRVAFGADETLLLWLGFVLFAGLGFLAVRNGRRSGGFGVALGALGGLCYAGSPLATRALVEPRLDLPTLAVAAVIPAYGVLGFWLYSAALQRVSVTAATTPLVLLETLVPAVVGVWFLGDGWRAGWEPVIVLGLALSLGGALSVEAVAGQRHPDPGERVAP